MAFFITKVKDCCCGCSLRMGTMIILWLTLIVDYLMLHYNVGYVANLREIPMGNKLATCINCVIYLFVTYCIVFQFIPCILAVYGVFMRKPKFLQPFILCNAVELVTDLSMLVGLFLTFIIVCANGPAIDYEVSNYLSVPIEMKRSISSLLISNCIQYFFGYLFVLAIGYYFICVIHTYYLELKEETKNPSSNIFVTTTMRGVPVV